MRETARAVAWGVALPAAIVALALVDARWLAARYGIASRKGWSRALLMVQARFAETSGILKFHANRLFRWRSALIEYK